MYVMFELAERLGKTVHELMTGEVAPISNWEFLRWSAFWKKRNALEKEAETKQSKGAKGGSSMDEPRRTMGQKQE